MDLTRIIDVRIYAPLEYVLVLFWFGVTHALNRNSLPGQVNVQECGYVSEVEETLVPEIDRLGV